MATLQQRLQERRSRRARRVRARILGTSEQPRLAVFRSLRHISAQLIDDVAGKTLLSASDRDLKGLESSPTETAALVGAMIAEKAKERLIATVIFDRRSYHYHGRVKALAEAARKGGLRF